MSRNFAAGVGKQTYAETVDILDEEFAALKQTVAAITRRSCAAQMDELLQHGREIARLPDLGDDVAFIEVATGRRAHGDSRFPILQ